MNEIGEAMQKLKTVAAVAVMVGGLGVVGSGVASAGDGPILVDNVQIMECEQSFDGGLAFAPINPVEVGEDNDQNTGNFCAQVAVED
ncbi:hypothetical protein AB0937_02720 [Streptomyces sp. NPDC047880]|uniref:hypothetical protein n=1 Tax=Streptomyces sp. NPDC047880 TaxID=3155626 RepID=UPI00345359C9